MSDIQIDDIYHVNTQTDSRHPNLPPDIQIGGQIWMSDIFKFGCHAPKLFYDVTLFAHVYLFHLHALGNLVRPRSFSTYRTLKRLRL